MTDVATVRAGDVIEQVVAQGDLARLTPEQRVEYYVRVCESIGLNPYTKPFEYIRLNGRLTLYARKDATDQLRRIHGVSLDKPEMRIDGDVIIVTVSGQMDNRTDTEIGVVSIAGLKGDARANAIMKAHTKAKRRLTLSICGLGWLDETELETISTRESVDVDPETGEIAQPRSVQRANARPETPQRRRLPEAHPEAAREVISTPGASNDAPDLSGEAGAIIGRLRSQMRDKLGTYEPKAASTKQQEFAANMLGQLFGNVPDEQRRTMRRQLIQAVTGTEPVVNPDGSLEDNWAMLDMHEASTFIDWAKSSDSYGANPDAVKEAAVILAAFGESQGQQRLPLEEADMGDKISVLVDRCWRAYLGEPASGDEAIRVAAEVFSSGYKDMAGDEVAFAIVNYFDNLLAEDVADQIGANLPNKAQIVGAMTEAAGRAGTHTTVSALQARASAVRAYVQSLVVEPEPEPETEDIPY